MVLVSMLFLWVAGFETYCLAPLLGLRPEYDVKELAQITLVSD